MRKTHATLEYPIVIKQVGEMIVFSCPDLKKTTSIPYPLNTKIDRGFLLKNASQLGKMWFQNHERLKDFEDSKLNPPKPSKISMSIGDRGTKPLTPNKLGKIMGLGGNTIRRAIERGEIKNVEYSPGGHVKIPLHSALEYAESRGFRIDYSLFE